MNSFKMQIFSFLNCILFQDNAKGYKKFFNLHGFKNNFQFTNLKYIFYGLAELAKILHIILPSDVIPLS